MARTLAPDLAAALPALVLWVRVTQARLEVLERSLGAQCIDCKWTGGKHAPGCPATKASHA
jgi:hypothetical protein